MEIEFKRSSPYIWFPLTYGILVGQYGTIQPMHKGCAFN